MGTALLASPMEVAPVVTSRKVALFLLLIYVLVALLFSFLCSIAEAVLLSVTPSYIESLKQKHPFRASLLWRLKCEQLDRSLAAILTLNTIAHTVGAIGAGAQAIAALGEVWFGVFSAVMTFLILFFSEIVPKTLGAVYWKVLSLPVAWFVKALIVGLFPIVFLSERLTRFLSKGQQAAQLSREELLAMAALGAASGQLRKQEYQIIGNLMRLDSLEINAVMTPRSVIFALSEEQTIDQVLPQLHQSPFSRIPVYSGGLDDINGFVLKDDLFVRSMQGLGEATLGQFKRDLQIVPETISFLVLFERLLKSRNHMVLVVDEHGATAGLVTQEDLLETLMGMEIVDETDRVVDMRQFARLRWEERARQMGLLPATLQLDESRGEGFRQAPEPSGPPTEEPARSPE
jgi:CBS domain containing-hemolysin-like protein